MVNKMKQIKKMKKVAVLCSVSLCLLTANLSLYGEERGCLHYDADIAGDKIEYFSENDKQVIVVTGGFVFDVDVRRVKAQKAVLWIKSYGTGQMLQHEITIYAEGNAEYTQHGVVATDSRILVAINLRGKIKVDSMRKASEATKKSSVYSNAVARLKQSYEQKVATPKIVLVKKGKVKQPKETQNGLIGVSDIARGNSLPEIAPASTATKSSKGVVATKTQNGAKNASAAQDNRKRSLGMSFHAKDGFQIKNDSTEKGLSYFISKGDVFISRGDPKEAKSSTYMEMEARSAVIFARETKTRKIREGEEAVPYATKAMGLGASGKNVTGIFLEGDVKLRRGSRRVRAESIYYDPVNNKALFLKPVVRTVQEQRNVPIIVRAREARQTSARDLKLYDAVITSSDFAKPTWAIEVRGAKLSDKTEYDDEGTQVSERKLKMKYKSAKYTVRGLPVFWSPQGDITFEQGHSPLKTAKIGDFKDFGTGLQTEWHLFRLLGMVKPEELSATLIADIYEKGGVFGIEGDYQKSRSKDSQYSGYFDVVGVYDSEAKDDFGDVRKNIESKTERGRILARHKEFFGDGWQVQGELSLMSDRNFLETYYRSEFWTGKEQENLIYAKKQRDNWAFTALMKARMNDFLSQTEAFPEVEGYLIGEPFFDDQFVYFAEARVGAVRYRDNDESDIAVRSDMMGRFDTRHEINMPLSFDTSLGRLNVIPFASARLSYWSDTPDSSQRALMFSRPGRFNNGVDTSKLGLDDKKTRLFGMVGARASMDFWKIYEDIDNDFWDIHRLKHIITPEVVVFGSATNGASPEALFPLSEQVENNIRENAGISFSVKNVIQTKRGEAGDRRTVDWMRFKATLGFFDKTDPTLAGNGALYALSPEYSRQRSFLSLDYYWSVSNSIAIMADASFDLDDDEAYDDDNSRLDIANIGVSVRHDPRLSYYAGLRYIDEYNSTVGTFGLNYQINKKYHLSLFEQYDFDYRGGVNLGTQLWIVRKFPRWYAGLSITYDARYDTEDELGVMLVVWPEGVPEAQPNLGRLSGLLNRSNRN